MARDQASSSAVIAISVTIGALALLTPLAIRLLVTPPPADESPLPKTPPNRQERLEREARRLTFTGDCRAGEFKDRRRIEDRIRANLRARGLGEIEVRVSDLCVAFLKGRTASQAQLEAAVRAAAHPWLRRVDAGGITVLSTPKPTDPGDRRAR